MSVCIRTACKLRINDAKVRLIKIMNSSRLLWFIFSTSRSL